MDKRRKPGINPIMAFVEEFETSKASKPKPIDPNIELLEKDIPRITGIYDFNNSISQSLKKIAYDNGFYLLCNMRQRKGFKVNLDYIMITNNCIYLVDVKDFDERVSFESKPLLWARFRVKGKKMGSLLSRVRREVNIVDLALEKAWIKMPVKGVLLFRETNLPASFIEYKDILISGSNLNSIFSTQGEKREVDMRKAWVALTYGLVENNMMGSE